ncbi:response regulator [Paenibacillus sp. MWE-103]|uniref:Response regulator n=1 Tax=Paenibacillus artemisiicola TaxID=1172618 RepID=A0ABS3W5H1_9BACL|nr:response regulator [Paenibacillus artemisiicola]MBO7743533.1 response regulator [Paenibacillus artemisiicola]
MNVLIVDDDHLVRKGIVSLMPWDDFDLKVVGEAENGKKGLQFLEDHHVDLIMTDIAMPTMSGIDLLRELRDRYPSIWVVMLTFYQDFEYVQEALRLGAIDYIAKVELEKDNMYDILGRIMRRISEGGDKASGNPSIYRAAGSAVPEASERALLFAALTPDRPDFLGELLPPEQQHAVSEIDRDVWLLSEMSPIREDEIIDRMFGQLGLAGKWAVIRAGGIRDRNRNRLWKLLADYAKHEFFYEYRYGRNVYDIELDAPDKDKLPLSEKELYELRERWSSLELLYDESRYAKLVAELEEVRPSNDKLESMFYWILVQWEKYVPLDPTALFDSSKLRFWADWFAWLNQVRQEIRSAFLGHHYSDDMMAGMMKAVDYINRNLSLDLKLTEVAEDVHISRSYFSECFKNITGKTFNEYVRDARIDHSKTLLSQTNEPIYRIAEKCGYPDEKYFSKVFRKKVGVLPSEIRKRKQEAVRR